MYNCPVCQTEYFLDRDVSCSTCHFDLTPYLPILGDIPESYLAKERAKLQWAQQVWQRVQEVGNLSAANTAFQIQVDRLQNENGDQDKEIDLINSENRNLANQITELESKLIANKDSRDLALQLSQTEIYLINEQNSELSARITALETDLREEQKKILEDRVTRENLMSEEYDKFSNAQLDLQKQFNILATESSQLRNTENRHLQQIKTLNTDLSQRRQTISSLEARGRRNFIRSLILGGVGSGVGLLGGIGLSKLIRGSRYLSPLPLSKIQFTSVLFDREGNIFQRPQGQSEIFQEDLGNGIFLPMIKVPAGKFIMGSPSNESGRDSDESPQHQVTVPELYFGQTLVTQSQWQQIMGDNPSHFKGDGRLPVENMNWKQANEFCQKLSEKTHRQYRLPSEAEWEYACRAGSTSRFSYGEKIIGEVANYNYDGEMRKSYEKTTFVDTFPPNSFGLYDMHGNVWEWCLDTWQDSYQGVLTDGTARLSQDNNNSHVLRGGSWADPLDNLRSANRANDTKLKKSHSMGLRVTFHPSWQQFTGQTFT
jgi:formylglycine-generating enzyme required for sulfatase activity